MGTPAPLLILTIGTRDLSLNLDLQQPCWVNLGDDRQTEEYESPQWQAIDKLGLDAETYIGQFRALTALLDQWCEAEPRYVERLMPVITGELFERHGNELAEVILIGTDQPETVRQRDRDTWFACRLFARWLQHRFPELPVRLERLGGEENLNPSDFEAMFGWWEQLLERLPLDSEQPLWIGLKGGIGRAAEAGRVAAITRYGERAAFFEFRETPERNRQGFPSVCLGPQIARPFIWRRLQREALQMLERYDYASAWSLLKPFLMASGDGNGAISLLLQAGIRWNCSDFETYFRLVTPFLDAGQRQQAESFWASSYEALFLARVRFEQNNLVEALIHSFRGVEHLLTEAALAQYPEHIQRIPGEFPAVSPDLIRSGAVRTPTEKLQTYLDKAIANGLKQGKHAALTGYLLKHLTLSYEPGAYRDPGLQSLWHEKEGVYPLRNNLAHQVQGLEKGGFLRAWSAWRPELKSLNDWDARVVTSLNLLSAQHFRSLKQASLFAALHDRLIRLLSDRQPGS